MEEVLGRARVRAGFGVEVCLEGGLGVGLERFGGCEAGDRRLLLGCRSMEMLVRLS
jgi:hypothetical protein